MVRRDVEQLEVVLIGFNLARAQNLKAHLGKNFGNAADGLGDGVKAPGRGLPPRQGDVQPFFGEGAAQFRLADGGGAFFIRGFKFAADFVGALADQRALFGRQFAHLGENLL